MGIGLAVLTAFASIVLLSLSGWFITASAVAGILAPSGAAITFNFIQPAAQIRALAIIRTLGRYGERLLTHHLTFQLLTNIRCWFFSQLIPLVPSCLGMWRSTDLMLTLTRDIETLDSLYLRLGVPFLVAFLSSCGVIIWTARYSTDLSIILLGFTVLTLGFLPWLFFRRIQETVNQLGQLTTQFKISLVEWLEMMPELHVLGALGRYQDYLRITSGQMIQTQFEQLRLSARLNASTLFLSLLMIGITLILAAIALQQQVISGADMVMLIFLVFALNEWIQTFVGSVLFWPETQFSLNRIRDITHLTPTIHGQDKRTLDSLPALQLDNISFRYQDNMPWLLRQMSLSVPFGDKIAIIGESGMGKTSLLHLLLHFWEPQMGQIYLANQPYIAYHPDFLLTQFAVLSQDNHLFSASLKENLLLAKPNASPLEINQAIQQAGLEQLVSQLPEGLDSWIGEQGIAVSGGEARRIALAQVYLKNAPILLLDEPTEGLDSQTEQAVLTGLSEFSQDKTLIMVTHRQAGLKLVDQIYRLEQGKLICQD